MRTRMVVPVVLWFAMAGAGAVAAAEPPQPDPDPAVSSRPERVSPTSSGSAKAIAKPPRPITIEEAALQVGVTVTELVRLRQLGYSDSEAAALLRTSNRSARDLIVEREVLSEIGKAIDEVSARVYQLAAAQQTAEREKTLRAVLARVRHDYRPSRDELRRILASTSYLTPDEQRRLVGGSAFRIDDLSLRRTGLFNRPAQPEKRATAAPPDALKPAAPGDPLPIDGGGFPATDDRSYYPGR